VQAVLTDLDSAPVTEPLRATLRLLRKVTREHEQVTAADVREVLAAGVTRAQIEDALNVCFAFNVITRLADTFAFQLRTREAADAGADRLLRRGYH
jgi:alkylhydroperoxidase family enzyme